MERVSAFVTMVPLTRGLLQGVNAKRALQEESISVLSPTSMVMANVRLHALPPFHFTPPKTMVLPPTSYAAKKLAVLVMVG